MAILGGCLRCTLGGALIPLAVWLAVVFETPNVVTLPDATDDAAQGLGSQRGEGAETPKAAAASMSQVDSIEVDRMGTGKMFDRIAFAYDSTNKVMSLGLDQRWRQALVEDCLRLEPEDHVLDLATGTADVGLLIATRLQELRAGYGYTAPKKDAVLGLDPSSEMLRIGVGKVEQSGFDGFMRLVLGDAQDMSSVRGINAAGKLTAPATGMATGTVDKVSMAFGIRNVPDRAKAIREMKRVLRASPSSRVCILEFSLPTGQTLLSKIANFFVTHAIPFIGKIATLGSGGDEYQYLERSILEFPKPLDFASSMAREGLPVISITSFAYGAVHLYAAGLPQAGAAAEAADGEAIAT